MKKTGKALSLVLSLALVVSSLTATFASAATNKSEYLPTVTGTPIDMVNGASGATSKTDLEIGNPVGVTPSTLDNLDVSSMTPVDAVFKSGNSLLTLKVDSGKVYAQLNDDNAVGSETIAVRYTKDSYRYSATSTPITFSAEVDYKITVHKLNSVSLDITGDELAKNASTATYTAAVDQWGIDSTKTGACTTTRLATATAQKVLAQNDTTKPLINGVASISGEDAANTAAKATEGAYYITNASLGGNKAIALSGTKDDGTDTSVTVTLTKPDNSDFLAVGTAAFYAQKITKASVSVADAATPTKAVLDTANTLVGYGKVANKLDLGSENKIIVWRGATWAVKSTDPIAAENDSSAKVPAANAINVTASNVDISTTTEMVKGSLATVNASAKFTVDDGYVSSIAAGTDVDVVKGSVGAITASGSVTVEGGSTSTITAPSVSVIPSDAKAGAKTGNIVAKTITINSTTGSVTTGNITLTATHDTVETGPQGANAGTLTLTGDKATVGTIDAQHYASLVSLVGFVGTVAAPQNAESVTLNTVANGSTDTKATVSGAIAVNTLDIQNGVLTASSANVNTVSGMGTLVIPAGALKVNKAISGIKLKLSDAQLTKGMTALYAPAYTVYDGSFTTVGFTLDYTASNANDTSTIQPYKILSTSFAAFNIVPVNAKDNKIAVGQKVTYKASVYPAGTQLPDGTAIKFDFSGSNDNFAVTTTADTITIEAKKFEPLFDSLDKGTITATLVDANDNTISKVGYDPATYDVQMIAKPEVNFTCDSFPTTMKAGQQYTVKITSNDGTKPVVKFANDFAVVMSNTTSGNATFVKFTAKTSGEHGVYVSGNRAAVIKVAGSICDTTTVSKKAGQPYTFKVTSLTKAAPTFVVAGIGSIKPSKVNGNAYYYTVKATSNKGVHGVYVNGAAIALYTFA